MISRMKSKSGISVMFMTFIAVSILSLIFISYYLYLTQHNLSASEAQRIYAEAAQESIDAFFYPPASEASSQGISQVLVMRNRGIGAVIKYLFYRDGSGLHGPLNGGDVVLRSGEVVRLQPSELIPDGAEMLIVTERGSVFAAQEGYFDISLNPASIRLPPGEEAATTLIASSSNYEGRLRIIPDAGCEVVGEVEFDLTRGGVYAVPVRCAAGASPGTRSYAIKVLDVETGYSKVAVFSVRVVEEGPGIGAPLSYALVIVPDENKSVAGRAGRTIQISFKVRSYNDYYGELFFEVQSEQAGLMDRVSFNPSSATLAPWDPEEQVTLSFRIRGNPGTYRIWIVAREGPSANPATVDTDYFDLTILP